MVKKAEMAKYEKVIIDENSITAKEIDETNIIPYNKVEEISKKSCKLCQSDLRKEAESQYDSTPNYKSLVNWLKGKGLDISYPAVRNHIIYHYRAIQNRQALLDYAQDVKKWSGIRDSETTSLKIRMAILERNMISIDAAGEDLPLEEKRKNAETVKKLADTLLACGSKMEEHRKKMEPVTIILNQLQIIIKDEIKENRTSETKQVLTNVLERLQETAIDID